MDKLEKIMKLLEKIEKMSGRKYPRTNIPFDLNVYIEFVDIYESLSIEDRLFLKDLMSERVKSRIRRLGYLAVEKSIELKDPHLIRIGLISYTFEDGIEYGGSYTILHNYCFAAKYLSVDISEIIDSLGDLMSPNLERNLRDYSNANNRDSLEMFRLKIEYRDDGTVSLVAK